MKFCPKHILQNCTHFKNNGVANLDDMNDDLTQFNKVKQIEIKSLDACQNKD